MNSHWFTSIIMLLMPAMIVSGQGFIDMTEALGMTDIPAADEFYGNGVSTYDFTGDGLDDLTICAPGQNPRFFRNAGGSSFTELDMNLSNQGLATNVLFFDMDNDGDAEVLINKFESDIQLFKLVNGVYQEITFQAGIAQNAAEGCGCCVADYDNDGFLDIYVSNNNFDEPLISNLMYHNNGDGTFTDVTEELGVGNGYSATLQSAFVDFNRDGWHDLFLANDRVVFPNELYQNTAGNFISQASELNANQGMLAMSATVGDFDNDSDLDIYVTNDNNGNILLKNQGEIFTEIAEDTETILYQHCWGAMWIDFDNNMWKDLYVATTFENEFMINNEGEDFTSVSDVGLSQSPSVTLSTAVGDFNDDGFPDMAYLSSDPEGFKVFYNEAVGGNYLKVSLEGVVSNRDAFGSFIEAWAGEDYVMEYTKCGEGYLAQCSKDEILGLGEHDVVDSLVITWPTGFVDTFYDVAVNQVLDLVEGETLFAQISASATSICPGQSVLLSAGDFAQYNWSNGDSTSVIEISAPGLYWVEVVTEEGLTYTTESVYIQAYESSEFSLSAENVACYADSTGMAVVTHVGGPAFSEVSWSNSVTGAQNPNLTAGLYWFEVEDINGCIYSGEVSIEQSDSLYAELATGMVSCHNGSDGWASIEAFGGSPGYIINWNGNDPLALPAGDYIVDVLDTLGCVVSSTFSISEPSALELSVEITDIETGFIATASVEGGSIPYNIEWSNDLSGVNTIFPEEGAFSVLVTDGHGCTISEDFTITDIPTLTDSPTVSLFVYDQNLYLDLTGFSEVPEIRIYSSSGSLCLSELASSTSRNSIDLSNLPSGVYLVQVLSDQLKAVSNFVK